MQSESFVYVYMYGCMYVCVFIFVFIEQYQHLYEMKRHSIGTISVCMYLCGCEGIFVCVAPVRIHDIHTYVRAYAPLRIHDVQTQVQAYAMHIRTH
jgi:hypothetical protein